MRTTLQEELQQRQPFKSLEEEAALNMGRTAALLAEATEAVLRPYGVSPPQYNVLRILRRAGEKGLGRNEIRDRLLSRMPDVTRLLVRLEEAGLLVRERSSQDRRYVPTRLTPAGLELVDRLDGPVARTQREHFAGLEAAQLEALCGVLTHIRGNLLRLLDDSGEKEEKELE